MNSMWQQTFVPGAEGDRHLTVYARLVLDANDYTHLSEDDVIAYVLEQWDDCVDNLRREIIEQTAHLLAKRRTERP